MQRNADDRNYLESEGIRIAKFLDNRTQHIFHFLFRKHMVTSLIWNFRNFCIYTRFKCNADCRKPHVQQTKKDAANWIISVRGISHSGLMAFQIIGITIKSCLVRYTKWPNFIKAYSDGEITSKNMKNLTFIQIVPSVLKTVLTLPCLRSFGLKFIANVIAEKLWMKLKRLSLSFSSIYAKTWKPLQNSLAETRLCRWIWN